MDNSENYRGLRDFAAALRLYGDSNEANYYNSVADTVAIGIERLFAVSENGFNMSDAGTTKGAFPGTEFYADTTSQVTHDIKLPKTYA
jgi:hypothetical protein